WREICPDLSIRSTFIVGFPGESEADFARLLECLEEAALDRVGCFKYSPVEGASANALADPVSEQVKEERYARFMERQEAVSRARLARKVGRTLTVLVDRVEDGVALARSGADAPESDGVVDVGDGAGRAPGDFVRLPRAA